MIAERDVRDRLGLVLTRHGHIHDIIITDVSLCCRGNVAVIGWGVSTHLRARAAKERKETMSLRKDDCNIYHHPHH